MWIEINDVYLFFVHHPTPPHHPPQIAVTVALLGGSDGAATCSRAVKVVGDSTLTEALAKGVAYDVLVLPGGLTGAQTFAKDATVQEAVKKQYASGRLVAAICACEFFLYLVAFLIARGSLSKNNKVMSHLNCSLQFFLCSLAFGLICLQCSMYVWMF